MTGLAPEFDLAREDWPLLAASDARVDNKFPVTAAYDSAHLARVPAAGERHVQDALFAAFSMFRQKDRWLSDERKREILTRARALLRQHERWLAEALARETGTALRDTMPEVERAMGCATLALAQLAREAEQPGVSIGSVVERLEPGGVLVAVLDGRHPLELAARAAFAAVASGCPIILNPGEHTPLAAMRIVHLLHEAGLPYVWAQVVSPESAEVAHQLVVDPRVALVSFAGRADEGWRLRNQLPPGTRCVLDHGGVTPALVATDADRSAAAAAITQGAFVHTSLDIGRIQRVYVADEQLADVAAELRRLAEAVRCGDPLAAGTDLGVLQSRRLQQDCARAVEAAVAAGATLLTGGRELASTGYAPTVLLNPPIYSQVATQPVAGPVVALFGYRDLATACDRANALPYGYSACVFTESESTLASMYTQLDASLVVHNGCLAAETTPVTLTGLRRSGLGASSVLALMHALRFRKHLAAARA